MISLNILPVLDLDKEYEGYEIKHLLKPIYTNRNYVDRDNSQKTRRYFEFILVDTGWKSNMNWLTNLIQIE